MKKWLKYLLIIFYGLVSFGFTNSILIACVTTVVLICSTIFLSHKNNKNEAAHYHKISLTLITSFSLKFLVNEDLETAWNYALKTLNNDLFNFPIINEEGKVSFYKYKQILNDSSFSNFTSIMESDVDDEYKKKDLELLLADISLVRTDNTKKSTKHDKNTWICIFSIFMMSLGFIFVRVLLSNYYLAYLQTRIGLIFVNITNVIFLCGILLSLNQTSIQEAKFNEN